MFSRRVSRTKIPRPTKCACAEKGSSRLFSTSIIRHEYADTIPNLKIGKHTRVMYQGFTGKQATANAQQSIEWGTHIVGGVKPGTTSEHLGLPVLPSVRAAKDQLNPDATAIFVAAQHAASAIEEAIEAEIPLIVAVAEHVPLHDVMRIHSILSTQSKSRLVGANAPGIISAIGKCRIGFQPLSTFSPGHIGIVAKSGTLSYETVGSLTRAGLGQSLCIGMGGDVIAGTNFVDGLTVFETDEDTEAIILVGELGGTAEEEAAEWIKDYKKRTKNPKPIAAVVGGFQAVPGQVMGHAGAWTGLGEGTSDSKYKALERAGVTMVDHPAKFGNVMKGLLASSGRNVQNIQQSAAGQRRTYHTAQTLYRTQLSSSRSRLLLQSRSLYITTDQAIDLLGPYDIAVSNSLPSDSTHFLGITVDRSARSPCIIASPTIDLSHISKRSHRFPFDYRTGPSQATVIAALEHLQLSAAPPAARDSAAALISTLWSLYKSQEALTVTVHISISPTSSDLTVSSPSFTFDDAAFKSAKRHANLHELRAPLSLTETEAEAAGIVYIPLPSPSSNSDPKNLVGTLVNGAGLAMNTLDVLKIRLPHTAPANFLDTGGKATAATIATSFRLILADPRVAVVFVNIFGGLTLCDMIAEGVILAYKEVGVSKPVVVRLRGTNEEAGRKILEESGLPILPFDGFEEAVQEVGRLVENVN